MGPDPDPDPNVRLQGVASQMLLCCAILAAMNTNTHPFVTCHTHIVKIVKTAQTNPMKSL